MSKLQVDTIYAKDAINAPNFPAGLTGTGATFTANVSIAGTLTYDDVTNVDAVGLITARTGVRVTAGGVLVTAGVVTAASGVEVTGGEGVKIDSGGLNVTSGVGTFKGDVELHGAQGVSSVTWDKSDNALEFVDNALLRIGTGNDLEIYHADSINYIKTSTTLPLYIQAPAGESMGRFTPNAGVELFYNGTSKLETVGTGVSVFGGMKVQSGLLRESVNIVANKLSGAPTISVDNGMLHYFTTTESTTSKPNIISSAGINTDMAIGDTMCLTVITTAAAAGYSFDWRVDGVEASAGVTSSWVGGSAPSAGNASGLDTYSLTFIKTASARYTMIGNLINSA